MKEKTAPTAGTVQNSGNLQVFQGVFSQFKAGVWNVMPEDVWNLEKAFNYIVNDEGAIKATDDYRRLMAKPGSKPEEWAKYKREKFVFVTFSARTEGGRRMEHVKSHSQLLCIDFDHLGFNGEPQVWMERLKADRLFMTAMSFVSPSADGLKWIISIDTQRASHKEWFEAVSLYLKERYGLVADSACSDIARPCYLPHDPDCYFNPAFTIEEMTRDMMRRRNEMLMNGGKLDDAMACQREFPVSEFEPKPYLLRMQGDRPRRHVFMEREPLRFGRRQLTDLEMAQLVARAVVAQGVDITADYPSWRDIGFALAHSLGEEARQTFHDVSALYARYSQAECDALYDICLSHPGPIRIGTFFMLARLKAGIYLKEELKRLNRR